MADEPELGDQAKESLRRLGSSMSFVGVVTALFGLMALVGGIVSLSMGGTLAAGLLAAQTVVLLLSGVWTTLGGRAMSTVYVTRGKDVTYLLEGVKNLRRLFGLQMVLITVVGAGGLLVVGYAMAGEGKRVIKSVVESLLL